LQGNSSHYLNLPLIEQNISSLPLVIAVVIKYWGEDIINFEGNKNHYISPNIINGIEVTEKNKFVSYFSKSTIRDLKKWIDQGIPPIVIFPGLYDLPQHALIISGYDDIEKRILTYIPQPDTIGFIPESKFSSEWNQEDNISIIIIPNDMKNLLPKDKLQVTRSYRLCFEAERDLSYGNLDSSIKKVTEAVEIDNTNAFAWSLLGSCYSEINNIECIRCFTQAVKLNATYFLAFRGLGNFYLKTKDYKSADKYYSKAIELNPNRYGPIYKNRAFSRLQLNRNQEAKQDLILYLEKTPNAHDREYITEALKSFSM
jgi:tetratricopeptide (TPR) repeat protein